MVTHFDQVMGARLHMGEAAQTAAVNSMHLGQTNGTQMAETMFKIRISGILL